MRDNGPEKIALAKFAGLAIGILLGGVLGPIASGPLSMPPPAASSIGCVVGALAGYFAVVLLLLIRRRRQDAEIRRAAEAVKSELGLPNTVTIKVKNGRITLAGEVENYSQREQAERAFGTIPGVIGVTNEMRLRSSAGSLRASADEIRKRITEEFLRQAERDSGGIRVELLDSRIVLKGTVRSRAEASEAEDVAWQIPGVVDVENRLQVAA